MKKLMFIVLFVVSINNTFSQNTDYNGIYLTSDDFVSGKVHLRGYKKQVKINVDLPFNLSQVRVKTEGKKYYFHKESIWGISESKHIYRFSNSKNYTLIANSGFLMYLRNGNDRHKRLLYFFSENASSEILPLTVKNLEKLFNSNKKFLELLHRTFLKRFLDDAFSTSSKIFDTEDSLNIFVTLILSTPV